MKDHKTIVITGASSGIGKATAIYFAQQGWNVAATMRSIENVSDFAAHPSIVPFKLDVTNQESIKNAISQILQTFPNIDVLYNNAGYALAGAFEATTDEQVRKQFETNLFGVMNVTRAFLPHFRSKRKGIILNTTSSGGILTFPLYSIYNSSKWALEGFMEALQFELKPFNISIKNIEPGTVKSEFTENISFVSNPDYDSYAKKVQHNTLAGYKNAPTPDVVAKVVFKAATDNRSKLRYPATSQAKSAFFFRWLMPLNVFNKMVSDPVEKEIVINEKSFKVNLAV
ncbi:SDR family oxidoreductase [Mucilaginibacter sp.]|uniref:SDR family oxidoreductase n=1 Tax=Mucilaginibacter sp. TaxID=1882438 RepID=UPI003B00D511